MALSVLVGGCSSDAEQEPPAADFTKLTVTSLGGFVPSVQGQCSLQSDANRYTVVASSHELEYSVCTLVSNGTSTELHTGKRTLSPAEFGAVQSAYAAVKLSTAKHCGADASVITLDVESPSGNAAFADDFYSGCSWQPNEGRTFVTGLPELLGKLEQMRD